MKKRYFLLYILFFISLMKTKSVISDENDRKLELNQGVNSSSYLFNQVEHEQEKEIHNIIEEQEHINLFDQYHQHLSPIQLPLESACLKINQVYFSGKEHFPLLQKQFKYWSEIVEGKCLGNEGIDIYLSYIQEQLTYMGYVTSDISIPQQSLLFGILKIDLIPGKVAKIIYVDDESEHFSLRNAFPINNNIALNLRVLEQGLENLQNAPFTQPTIHISEDPYRADLSIIAINRQKKRGFKGRVTFDSRPIRGAAVHTIDNAFFFSNPLMSNDFLYLSLGRNTDINSSRSLKNAVGFYSIPYNYWQFNLFGYYQDSYDDRGLILSNGNAYRLAQRSRYLSFQAKYLLHRDNNTRTSLAVGTQVQTLDSILSGMRLSTQKRFASYATMELMHRWILSHGQADFTLGYKQATDWFGANLTHHNALERAQIYQFSSDISFQFSLFSQSMTYNNEVAIQLTRSPLDRKLDIDDLTGRGGIKGFVYAKSVTDSNSLQIKNEISWLTAYRDNQIYWGVDYGSVSEDRGRFWHDKSLLGTEIGIKGKWKFLDYKTFIGTPLWRSIDTEVDPFYTGIKISITY